MLGCNGLHSERGLILCYGVENVLFDFDLLTDVEWERVRSFLLTATYLMEGIEVETSKCQNIVALLSRNYDILSKEDHQTIQKFIYMHKECGIWMEIRNKEQ